MPNRRRLKVSQVTDFGQETKPNAEYHMRGSQISQPIGSFGSNATVVLNSLLIMVLTVACCRSCQLSLAPVYGSIPSAHFHAQLAYGTIVCAISVSCAVRLPRDLVQRLISLSPVLAFWIPTIQFLSFRQSSRLGPKIGPLVTESITCLPLLFASTIFIIHALRTIASTSRVAVPVGGLCILAFYQRLQTPVASVVLTLIHFKKISHQLTIQLLVGCLYAIRFPSRLLLLSVPAILHTLFYNVHAPFLTTTAVLNTTLQSRTEFQLLERRQSKTGYISVLTNLKDHYRVLRCDHSLLGGVWMSLPGQRKSDSKVEEPIYAVFAMMEAVRLVKIEDIPRPGELDSQAGEVQENALVIGLGIGTSSAALVAHGINTTTVEIDPILEELASKYFNLPSNHTTVVDDAVNYVSELRRSSPNDETYTYIIHDVFTGGAEPVALFTVEFLTDLSSLLKPDGVIAINYAGDLLLPSARLVIQTILAVFSSCRIYRETAPPPAPSTGKLERDFTNMVIFCIKSSAGYSRSFSFRQPTEDDFLGSHARRSYLLPRHEIKHGVFQFRPGEGPVLSRDSTDRLSKWHEQSAVGHWHIMRSVLPAEVWENW